MAHFNRDDETPKDSLVDEIMQAICEQSYRWENIGLVLPKSAISHMLDSHLPLLKTHELRSYDESGAIGGDVSLCHVSELKELALKEVVYVVFPDATPSRLSSIRSIVFVDAGDSKCDGKSNSIPEPQHCLIFSSVFPLLEILTLTRNSDSEPDKDNTVTDQAEFVVLTNLLSLNVVVFDANHCFPLNAITVPALKHLKLEEFSSYYSSKRNTRS